MRFHADLTERQIGRELGISQPQVSRLLGAALTRLRTELENANSSGGQGDIGVNRPISPASGDDPALKDARKSARNASKQRNAADKIAGVPVAQDTASVAQYLELPYTVAVHCEREGEKSVWNATAEELPGCAAQGRTPDEAVELLRGAMESWIEAALAQGREVPVPGAQAKQQTSPSHSGRFLVRMPSVLHTQLAEAAEREHLSLNRFITKLLTASVSAPASAPRPRRDSDARSASATPSRGFRIALATNVAVVVLAALGAIVLLVLALQHGV
jgi:predicted RNase H-like HicB family nuclease